MTEPIDALVEELTIHRQALPWTHADTIQQLGSNRDFHPILTVDRTIFERGLGL